MTVPADILNNLFSLPPSERFILAQQLLDSIDESDAAKCDQQFAAELLRRRDEMIRGEHVVSDWREALAEVERSLAK